MLKQLIHSVATCTLLFTLAVRAEESKPKLTTKPATNLTTKPTNGPTTAQALRAEKEVPPTGPEEAYYKIIPIPIPQELVLEISGLETMPDGRLFAGTRRGDIYLVENAYADPADKVKFTRWATGLHEIMGLAQRDGWIYASQRGEITRLKDANHSGHADTYETFYDGWGIRGDYHEKVSHSHRNRSDRGRHIDSRFCRSETSWGIRGSLL